MSKAARALSLHISDGRYRPVEQSTRDRALSRDICADASVTSLGTEKEKETSLLPTGKRLPHGGHAEREDAEPKEQKTSMQKKHKVQPLGRGMPLLATGRPKIRESR